jgi:hypothetical protein
MPRAPHEIPGFSVPALLALRNTTTRLSRSNLKKSACLGLARKNLVGINATSAENWASNLSASHQTEKIRS